MVLNELEQNDMGINEWTGLEETPLTVQISIRFSGYNKEYLKTAKIG